MFINKIKSQEFLTNYASLGAFLFFALSLILPSGYSYGPALLTLASLPFLFKKSTYQNISLSSWLLIAAFIIFSSVWAMEILIHYNKYHNLEKPIRFLASLAVLFFLLKYPPKQTWVWLGVALGALGTGIFAIYLKQTTGIDRVSGHSHNAIQYGNLSLLLGFLSLTGVLWALQLKKYKYLMLSLLVAGFIFASLASILSGSRGGWIAAPIILGFIIYNFKYFIAPKILILLSLVISLLLVSSYFIPATGVQVRVNQVFIELDQYKQGETKTSVGTRLEFWRAALIIAQEKPLLGWGKPDYLEKLEELVEEGVVAPAIISDPHNMYLTMLAFRGAVGLISLLILFITPIYIFNRALANSVNKYQLLPLVVAGICIALAYIDFGLTQTTLKFNSGTTFFCFSLIIIYTCLQGVIKETAKTTSNLT